MSARAVRLCFIYRGAHPIVRLRSLVVVPHQPPKLFSFRVYGSYPPNFLARKGLRCTSEALPGPLQASQDVIPHDMRARQEVQSCKLPGFLRTEQKNGGCQSRCDRSLLAPYLNLSQHVKLWLCPWNLVWEKEV